MAESFRMLLNTNMINDTICVEFSIPVIIKCISRVSVSHSVSARRGTVNVKLIANFFLGTFSSFFAESIFLLFSCFYSLSIRIPRSFILLNKSIQMKVRWCDERVNTKEYLILFLCMCLYLQQYYYSKKKRPNIRCAVHYAFCACQYIVYKEKKERAKRAMNDDEWR